MRKLDSRIVELLQKALIEEYTAFYFYRNASNYCKNVGFDNAEKYFAKESADELTHAKKLEDYITDWNVQPSLEKLSSPEQVTGLKNAIQKAYDMELALYDLYNEISEKIEEQYENCELYGFLQFFRDIQRTSVAEYSTFLNKLALIDSNDKFQVYMFEKEEFENE